MTGTVNRAWHARDRNCLTRRRRDDKTRKTEIVDMVHLHVSATHITHDSTGRAWTRGGESGGYSLDSVVARARQAASRLDGVPTAALVEEGNEVEAEDNLDALPVLDRGGRASEFQSRVLVSPN